MSGILDLMNNLNESVAMERHPIAESDVYVRISYLNGLALIMNVDEDICEAEKKYMQAIMKSANIESEKMDEFINFAKNPNMDMLKEILSTIKENNLAQIFLLDCLIISWKDENVHDNEKALIEQYIKNLGISPDDKKILFNLSKGIRNEDVELVYNSLFSKDIKNQIKGILEYHNIDIEIYKTKLDRLFTFETEVWSFSYGYILEGDKASLKPVLNEQYRTFLQYRYDRDEIFYNESEKMVETKNKADILISLEASDITFEEGKFKTESPEGLINGITFVGAEEFSNYVNELFDISTKVLSLGTNYSGNLIKIDEKSVSFPKGNNSELIFHINRGEYINTESLENFGENRCGDSYYSPTVNRRDVLKNTTFRLMIRENN